MTFSVGQEVECIRPGAWTDDFGIVYTGPAPEKNGIYMIHEIVEDLGRLGLGFIEFDCIYHDEYFRPIVSDSKRQSRQVEIDKLKDKDLKQPMEVA